MILNCNDSLMHCLNLDSLNCNIFNWSWRIVNYDYGLSNTIGLYDTFYHYCNNLGLLDVLLTTRMNNEYDLLNDCLNDWECFNPLMSESMIGTNSLTLLLFSMYYNIIRMQLYQNRLIRSRE